MKEKINNFIKTIFNKKELIVSISSLFISFLYTIYNIIIGIINSSIFNGIISIYYLLLTVCNSILIYRIYRTKKSEKPYKITYIFIYIILFLLTISFIGPAILLLLNDNIFFLDTIYSIVCALFTTISMTFSIINYVKARKEDNENIKLLRLCNLISSLLSIIILQNILILTNGELDNDMFILSIFSTCIIILFIIVLIIISSVYKKVAEFCICSSAIFCYIINLLIKQRKQPSILVLLA